MLGCQLLVNNYGNYWPIFKFYHFWTQREICYETRALLTLSYLTFRLSLADGIAFIAMHIVFIVVFFR